jgi:hypothetical protein
MDDPRANQRLTDVARNFVTSAATADFPPPPRQTSAQT